MTKAFVKVLISILVAGTARGQIGPCATPVGPELPDLIIDRRALRAEKLLSEQFIESNDCQLVEGCVNAAGTRRLLRFTTNTPNIGQAALVIGDPAECDLLFHFSECHGHYHLEQYADYRLWTRGGYKLWRRNRDWTQPVSSTQNAALLQAAAESGDLIAGRKQGFCMVDSSPYRTKQVQPGPRVFVDCLANQGISVGWSDDYPASLDCQFIDVTDATPGRRVLEVEVNPDRVLPESDYRNNSATARVRIPR